MFTFGLAYGQLGCGTVMPSFPIPDDGVIPRAASPLPALSNCGKNSNSYNDYFKRPDNYMPFNYYRYGTSPSAYYPNRIEPTKTVVINVVFFGEDDGTWFPYSPTTYSQDSILINDFWLNEIYQHPDTSLCSPYHPLYFPNSGITIKLHKLYYYPNSAILHANDNQSSSWYTNALDAMNYHLSQNPDAANQLNCIVTQKCGYPGAQGIATAMTYNNTTIPMIISGSQYYQQYYGSSWPGDFSYFRNHLPHEIGHHLGLHHLYQNAEHSIYNSSVPWDFLDDVFPSVPPQSSFLGCNNLMRAGNSGQNDGNHVSPLQAGRMHRSLSTDINLISAFRHYAYGYSEIPYVLEQNETWDFTYKSYQDIVVPKDKTLTITCQLEMVPRSKIIVEPGGQLIVDGGLITAAKCGGKEYEGYWGGIEVRGTYDKPQVEAYQGKVILKNGAIIEFAQEAVMPWVYNDWTKTGGIIIAVDAIFRNNNRSVQYMGYQNFGSSTGTVELANRGRFTNCTFIWDNDCFEVMNRPAITLNGVKGVKMEGCTFNDMRTNIGVTERARGIFSIDAGYLVQGKASTIIGTPHQEYDETNYDVGEFINLWRGIEIEGSGSYYANIIDHVKFTNCTMGIYVRGTDNPIITRNRFNYIAPLPAGFTNGTGAKVQNSTGFKIEGNQFYNTIGNNAVYSLGCVVHSAGEEENKVYKNKYDRNEIANQGILYNRNINPFAISGLEYNCNNHTFNRIDFNIDNNNDHDGGVKLLQGTPQYGSQNLLTISPYRHIVTRDSSNYMNYYWKGTNNKPTLITGSVVPGNNVVIVTESNNPFLCPTSFQNIVIEDDHILTSQDEIEMQQERMDLLSQISELELPYLQHLSEGDATSLYTQVANITASTKLATKNALLAKSPYLSLSLRTELGNVPESLFSKDWLKDILLANIESIEDYDFRMFLMTKNEPFNANDMEMLQDAYLAQKTSKFALREEISTLKGDLSYIDNWLLTNALHNEDEAVSSEVSLRIEDRNHVTKNAELMDYYFGLRNWNLFESSQQNLEAQLSDMPSSRLKTELMDQIIVLNYSRSQLNSFGSFDLPLLSEQLAQFQDYKETLSGRAALYASNILCFWANICEEEVISDPFENHSNKSMIAIETQKNQGKSEIKIYPNPNDGTFNIELESGEIEKIVVLDIHGRKVQFEHSFLSSNKASLALKTNQTGVFVVQVQLKSGKTITSRILKN